DTPREPDGTFRLPRISSRTLYLWGKINSPLAEPDVDPETGEVRMVPVLDPKTREPVLDHKTKEPLKRPKPRPVSTDQLFEAVYVLLKQDDPRIIKVLKDREALERAVYEMSGQISIQDIGALGAALSQQVEGLNAAVAEEGFSDQKKEEAASGSTISPTPSLPNTAEPLPPGESTGPASQS
ncbi:MAG: hypothetical protein WC485_03640, partial [Opitutaceae bacterium]